LSISLPPAFRQQAVAAVLLGGVKGAVGGGHQGIGVGHAVFLAGDADADAGLQAHAVGFDDFAAYFLAQAFGGMDGGPKVGIVANDQEFLAADAADMILAARAGADQLADPGQHLVAHRVAMRVVDALEAVDVDHHHRQAAPSGRRRSGLAQHVHAGAAVGQAGEQVGHGVVFELAVADGSSAVNCLSLARSLSQASSSCT
jgi:hypothetical protein